MRSEEEIRTEIKKYQTALDKATEKTVRLLRFQTIWAWKWVLNDKEEK